jgi:hypothetical protein
VVIAILSSGGSVLYLAVTIIQIRLYGFRMWMHHGCGAGEDWKVVRQDMASDVDRDLRHSFHDVLGDFEQVL